MCMCFTGDFGLLGVCVSRGRSVLRSVVVTSVTVTHYAGLCLFRLPCLRYTFVAGCLTLIEGHKPGRELENQNYRDAYINSLLSLAPRLHPQPGNEAKLTKLLNMYISLLASLGP